MKRISVFLVDDSALVRQLTADLLACEPDIEIAGTAPDPVVALPKIKALQPDVVLLDIEMPRMDGLQFLGILRTTSETRNIPVLMFSSLTESGCNVSLQALERGAVDVVTKPKLDLRRGFDTLIGDLLYKVRAAAQSKRSSPSVSEASMFSSPLRSNAESATPQVDLIAIGCSTGGPEALRQILPQLPAGLPPIVIVQHMHERFTGPFASRLDGISGIRVKEASDGEKLAAGHAYLARGSLHLEVQRAAGGSLRARLSAAPAVNGHRPSVDVLFHSCVKATGAATVAAILTGMGNDGAEGLLALRQVGAQTIAQNEASCVVFGMPMEAIAIGAAVSVLPLPAIAKQILALTARSV